MQKWRQIMKTKAKLSLTTLSLILVFSVASFTPQLNPLTPSEVVAGDHVGYKNKFLRKGCKSKQSHICETGGDSGLIKKIIDTVF